MQFFHYKNVLNYVFHARINDPEALFCLVMIRICSFVKISVNSMLYKDELFEDLKCWHPYIKRLKRALHNNACH